MIRLSVMKKSASDIGNPISHASEVLVYEGNAYDIVEIVEREYDPADDEVKWDWSDYYRDDMRSKVDRMPRDWWSWLVVNCDGTVVHVGNIEEREIVQHAVELLRRSLAVDGFTIDGPITMSDWDDEADDEYPVADVIADEENAI